jgi:enoyl-CoA hydratase/carnithine racemase
MYELKGNIAHLVFNRPEILNAIGKTTLNEINAAMDRAEADDAVRVIVISGAGKRFSSGFDLKEQMERRPVGANMWREILDLDFNTTMRFWDSPKPTIAAVHGACLAGALEIALSCDLTVAGEDAVFGEPELKFGAGIVTMLLPWMTGPKQEALRIARRIAVMDPNLVAETKKALNRSYEIQGMQAALKTALDIDHTIESHGSPDKQAFMEIARERGLRAAITWRDARFADKSSTE